MVRPLRAEAGTGRREILDAGNRLSQRIGLRRRRSCPTRSVRPMPRKLQSLVALHLVNEGWDFLLEAAGRARHRYRPVRCRWPVFRVRFPSSWHLSAWPNSCSSSIPKAGNGYQRQGQTTGAKRQRLALNFLVQTQRGLPSGGIHFQGSRRRVRQGSPPHLARMLAASSTHDRLGRYLTGTVIGTKQSRSGWAKSAVSFVFRFREARCR